MTVSSQLTPSVFLLFGISTIVLAVAAFFLVVDFPEKSKFLTAEQKQFVIDRIEQDRGDSVPDKLTGATFNRAITDAKIWCYSYLFMTATTGSYACELV